MKLRLRWSAPGRRVRRRGIFGRSAAFKLAQGIPVHARAHAPAGRAPILIRNFSLSRLRSEHDLDEAARSAGHLMWVDPMSRDPAWSCDTVWVANYWWVEESMQRPLPSIWYRSRTCGVWDGVGSTPGRDSLRSRFW